MNKNKIWLLSGTVAIIVAVVLCCVILSVFRLEERVFFKNYLTVQTASSYDEGDGDDLASRECEFEIQYLTNWDDRSRINYLEFPDHPELIAYVMDMESSSGWDFFSDDSEQQNRYTYGLYSVKNHKVTIWLNGSDETPVRLETALVYFNDGAVQEVDLGCILLTLWPPNDGLLTVQETQYSDMDTSDLLYIAEETITLQEIRMQGGETAGGLDEMVKITVNGADYKEVSGMRIEKGGELTIESQFLRPYGTPYRYNHYDLRPQLCYTDENGNPYSLQLDFFYYNPVYNENYDFKDLAEWLNEREESHV